MDVAVNRVWSNATYLKFFLLLCFALPSMQGEAVPPPNPKIKLMPGLGSLHHPVSTSNPEAQKFFDQGLTLVYAFNHDAAYWSFQKASELDPQLGMAYWGMALALGNNLNKADVLQDEHQAYALIQKALTLAPKAPKSEQAYIEALSKRYTNDAAPDYPRLNSQYVDAMRQLAQRYPDDPDAATLYAESIMDKTPWAYWTLDGKPNEGTLELVETLENVIKRYPQHLGANHYYIHAMEESPHPEYALASAMRLPQLAPAAGHIIHMPSHVYLLIGDYKAAADANVEAVKADKAYIKEYGMLGTYAAHYMGHNLDMLLRAYSLEGRSGDALKTAQELSQFYAPYHTTMANLEFRMDAPTIYVLLSFHRWKEILQLPKPDPKLAVTTALWLAARGIAEAALGNVAQAKQNQQAFIESMSKIPETAIFGLNKARKILKIAENVLGAQIAQAEHNNQQAVELLQKAVIEEDTLAYDDPSDWYYPIRESLGGLLLREKRYQEAEEVFRKALEKHPRNGRALFGILESMKGQGKTAELFWIQQAYNQAWKNADVSLTIDNL